MWVRAMNDRHLTQLTEQELLSQLAECISLEGEAKATAEPLRKELLRRQTETGETVIEHDGWQSTLTREQVSAAWVERQYGYPKDEIPVECFEEKMTLAINGEKVAKWLEEKGHEFIPSYALKIGRKRKTTMKASRNA